MNDSIRAFFACFQSTYEPVDNTNRSHTISIISKIIFSKKKIILSLSIIDSSAKRTNSPATSYGQNTNVNSMDGDEYCRITIDSLTKSYKIDSPVKPRILNSKHTRSASHSLLNTPYMEGKRKLNLNKIYFEIL